MKIESIRLRNFKTFRDVHLTDVPPMLVVVGANGTGKSTLFDVFSFLRDCLTYDVRKALNRRGGFREVLSRDCGEDFILLKMAYRQASTGTSSLLTYTLKIGDPASEALILEEDLEQLQPDGSKTTIFCFTKSERKFTPADAASKRFADQLNLQLASPHTLALQALRVFRGYSEANELHRFLTSFHLFDFDTAAAVGRKERIGDPEQLSESGANLALVARTLYEQHPDVFARILERLARHVPGLAGVEPLVMEDGSLILRFQDGSFKAPFLDRQMSDGTVKLFAYLVLLYDPRPRPFLGIDEPENHLYPKLMAELAEEFRYYATRGGGQMIIATHSPDFLGATTLEEVCWLVKRNGRTDIRRAQDDPQLAAYMATGDHMGYLWSEGLFTDADPK